MKKLMTAVLAAAAIASIGAVTSVAAVSTNCPYYTDANGDGICDNHDAHKSYNHHGHCNSNTRCGAPQRTHGHHHR